MPCKNLESKIHLAMKKHGITEYSVTYEKDTNSIILTMQLPQKFFVSSPDGISLIERILEMEFGDLEEFDGFSITPDILDDEEGYDFVIVEAYFDCIFGEDPT